MNKLKFLFHEQTGETDTEVQELHFNDKHKDKPISCAGAKWIKYKDAAHLALLMLSEERETKLTPCVTSLALHVTLKMTISSATVHSKN